PGHEVVHRRKFLGPVREESDPGFHFASAFLLGGQLPKRYQMAAFSRPIIPGLGAGVRLSLWIGEVGAAWAKSPKVSEGIDPSLRGRVDWQWKEAKHAIHRLDRGPGSRRGRGERKRGGARLPGPGPCFPDAHRPCPGRNHPRV